MLQVYKNCMKTAVTEADVRHLQLHLSNITVYLSRIKSSIFLGLHLLQSPGYEIIKPTYFITRQNDFKVLSYVAALFHKLKEDVTDIWPGFTCFSSDSLETKPADQPSAWKSWVGLLY